MSEITDRLWKLYDKFEDKEHEACGDAAKLIKAYENTGLTPEKITALKSERDALVERCGGTIPVHCSDCELWGSNGWSQHGVGYCEGDSKPHEGTDFCSYGKKRRLDHANR